MAVNHETIRSARRQSPNLGHDGLLNQTIDKLHHDGHSTWSSTRTSYLPQQLEKLRRPSILGRTPGHGGSDSASLAGMWISFENESWLGSLPCRASHGEHICQWIQSPPLGALVMMIYIRPPIASWWTLNLRHIWRLYRAPRRTSFSGWAGQQSFRALRQSGLGMRGIADDGKFNAYYFYRGGSERSSCTSIICCSQAGPPFCQWAGPSFRARR